MSVGFFELVNGVLTKRKIAGKTLMDAQLNANSRNGVQNRIITGEINDIKDDISTINTHLTENRTDAIVELTLSDYTTTPYVFPHDGWISIMAEANGGSLSANLLGSNVTSGGLTISVVGSASYSDENAIFVKKGMKMTFYLALAVHTHCYYMPLVD